MPKKHHKALYNKPPTSIHPSLTPAPSNAPRKLPSESSSNSVNELIAHLRRSQAPSPAERLRDEQVTPTVHPSLRAILQIPDSPPPRPRGAVSRASATSRGPPGPPPPRSWLIHSIHAPPQASHGRHQQIPGISIPPNRVDRLPGLRLPEERSLLHEILKALAKNWHWHVQYDQYYLATLPTHFKEVLLSYVAVYNNHKQGGVGMLGLETLFLDDAEVCDGTGSDGVTHLDLACFLSQASLLKHLGAYMIRTVANPNATALPTPNQAPSKSGPEGSNDSDIIEDWSNVPNGTDTMPIHQPIATPRFPHLTHLSLSHSAHPAASSWRNLLAIAPHLATITHLSLAYWPVPSLTPNSKTASTISPVGRIDYGASNFYSASDGDWSEAAGVLRRLSRALYCLKWLDLEGCENWLEALGWRDTDGGGGVEWNAGWRGIQTVRVGQGWIPECLEGPGGGWRETMAGRGTPGSSREERSNGREEQASPWDLEFEKTGYFARKELLGWLRTEIVITDVAKTVGDQRRCANGRTINLERGWEGWWIRDAILQTPALT